MELAKEQKSEELVSYLRLELSLGREILLPLAQLREVLLIEPERLTVMPNVPVWVLGLLHQRSQIIWVLDLADFCGCEPNQDEENYTIVIVQIEAKALGLRILRVQGITAVAPEQKQSPVGKIPSALEPYLSGCIIQGEKILPIVELSALIRGARQAMQPAEN